MKISYNWLKQYIQIDLPPEQLSDILTNIGLEVEGIETFQSVKGGLEGVVIGEVLTCSKHPNADKLTITTVDVGKVGANRGLAFEGSAADLGGFEVSKRPGDIP